MSLRQFALICTVLAISWMVCDADKLKLKCPAIGGQAMKPNAAGKYVMMDQTVCDVIRDTLKTPAMRNPFMPDDGGSIEDDTVDEMGGNFAFFANPFNFQNVPSRNDKSKTANCWRHSAISACLDKFNAECATPAERAKPAIPYLVSRLTARIATDCA